MSDVEEQNQKALVPSSVSENSLRGHIFMWAGWLLKTTYRILNVSFIPLYKHRFHVSVFEITRK